MLTTRPPKLLSRMLRTMVVFRSQKGSASKKVWEHWTSSIRTHIRSENSTIVGRSCDLLVYNVMPMHHIVSSEGVY
jgi:hypothetical protein